MNSGFKSLNVFKRSYKLAMRIFEISKTYPKSEMYSLTDQIRRSSRSVCANIGEGHRKRRYPKHFTSKISDADSECSETLIWLDFSKDCGYITSEIHNELTYECNQIGKMLGSMANCPEKFITKTQ